MIQKQFHFACKVGAAGCGLLMAGLVLTAIWHNALSPELAEVWRKLFGSSVITCLVCMFGVIFSWDGSI